jgi:AraC-like DNA-binding protein
MELLARTRIVMWQGGSLWVVSATRPTRPERQTDVHAHHAIQITFSLGGAFSFTAAGRSTTTDAVAVPPDLAHAFAAEGLLAILFVEPESRPGRAISRRLFDHDGLAEPPLEIFGAFPARIRSVLENGARRDEALVDIGRSLVDHLAGGVQADRPDLRVRRMMEVARQQIEGRVSLLDTEGVGGLSASRLRHLFVENTGLAFKTYVLWLRLMRAVETFAAGGSLTQAAHDAGFADQAHLSRTFRRMFGIAPTSLAMA